MTITLLLRRINNFLSDLREVRHARAEHHRWYARHMKLRTMEFGPATPWECFCAARAISQSPAETVWVYESLLGRVGRARSIPGRRAAPTLAYLVALYDK